MRHEFMNNMSFSAMNFFDFVILKESFFKQFELAI